MDGKNQRIKVVLKNGEHFFINETISDIGSKEQREKAFEKYIKSFDDLSAIKIYEYSGIDIDHIKFVDESEGKIGY
ncbi:hypothetical protein G8Y85_08480 [Staphylococcus sp. 11007852]|uniref:hypothetical protein n=1 Tax=Staphylococcus TaxID=1279 RepID=UPI001402A87E|nr:MULTISPECIES: hypothetical protein [Staphylococcus]NHM75430.1 hypothetical protein [Staphylococcus sp. 11007852]NJH83311.1 hypothetical protein [Staphylococcus agnetis]